VTLINNETLVRRPPSVDASRHLLLGVNDICDPADGIICPAAEHVEELLRFFGGWDRDAPAIVHCFAGISRSTAAAYSVYCALRPELDEVEVALRLRSRSPEASPNARIVSLADQVLGRGGRMVDAVERIGRGRDAQEGTIFSLRLDE
jgi:predicted protein tyrosine phosphatase